MPDPNYQINHGLELLGIKMRSTIQMPQKNMYCRYGYHYKMLPNRIAVYRLAPKSHNIGLFEAYNDPETGFVGLSPEDRKTMNGLSIPMKIGDALCFSQCTPHRAPPNRSSAVRWSMDFRYEATNNSTEIGRKQGFKTRNPENPNSLTKYEEWLDRWSSIPSGSY